MYDMMVIFQDNSEFTTNLQIFVMFLVRRSKSCWNRDCDGSETKTSFTLLIDWDCKGNLATTTRKNGREKIADSTCYGSQCKLPDCPENSSCGAPSIPDTISFPEPFPEPEEPFYPEEPACLASTVESNNVFSVPS